MTKKLTRENWIIAGFRALTSGGPQSIRVEAIARDLKVSKGSFYWHFKNHAELKTSMLQHWMNRATDIIINQLEQQNLTADQKLELLVDVTTRMDVEEYGGALAEPSIRDWAKYDEEAAETLLKVDRKRLDYLVSLFSQTGMDNPASKSSANILYAGLIGLNHLSSEGLADQNRELMKLLRLILPPQIGDSKQKG